MNALAIVRSLHPQIEDPWEHMIYWDHVRSADAGQLARSVSDIAAYLDCGEGGTRTTIERRMEDRGWIKVERFQKGRRITIVATGAQTKMPKCVSPHWREKAEHQDPLRYLSTRHPDMYARMIKQARRERKGLGAFMAALMIEGFNKLHSEGMV